MTKDDRRWSYVRVPVKQVDCGYLHGRNAGRITACERTGGMWDVVFFPVRGDPQILRTFADRTSAIEYGWAEYGARMGWRVPMASDSGA